MPAPVAYFITWTCNGQRLHGDPAGSVNRHHNRFGHAPLDPSQAMHAIVRARMKGAPIVLSEPMRDAAAAAIRDHCAVRGWTAEALNVRTTHIHIVVRVGDRSPEQVMGQFKSWATRRLRESGLLGHDTPVWTDHGSTRYLWREADVPPAVRYVLDMQDDGARYVKAPWEA